MRQTIGAIALAVGTGFLGWVMGGRNRMINHPSPVSYEAALYSAHVIAVDSGTGKPVDFQFSWSDEINPFPKGSGPGKIEKFADLSQSISLVGLDLAQGLELLIRADGHAPGRIWLKSHRGGIGTDGPDRIVTVTLEKEHAESSDIR